ncbi:MAG: Maltose acetyltransferase [Icmadophila ericetorum]|nr:Maltose acetyltransferase [Icmadophila ericetorum]
MAAVASTSSPDGLRGLNHDRPFADPNHASGFTAVNNQSSPKMKVNAVVNGHEPSTNAPEEYSSRATPAPMQLQNSSQSPNKRKRSHPEDDDGRNDTYRPHGIPPPPPPPPPPADRQESQVTSPRVKSPYMNGRANIEDANRRISADAQRPLDSPHFGPPRPMGNDYDPRGPPHQPYYNQQPPPPGPSPDSTEARLAEALLRDREANGSQQAGVSSGDFGSPEGDDGQNGQYGKYTSGPRSLSGADENRKRRKRVFSNRTKTGCLTCRKRKKKCDEAHPECNNCLRGGFVCEGYTSRNTWQKPTPSKVPVPLQSKTGYPDGPPGPMQNPQYPHNLSPELMTDAYAQQRYRNNEGERMKPIVLDEDVEMSASPASRPRDLPPWTKAPLRNYPVPPQGPPPPLSGPLHGPPHGIPRGPPLGPPPNPVHGPSRPFYSHHPNPEMEFRFSSGSAPPHHSSPDQSVSYPSPNIARSLPAPYPAHSTAPPSVKSSSASAVAQAALAESPELRSPSPVRPAYMEENYKDFLAERERNEHLTEREKMLKGDHFLPYTPALMADRERCLAACWHFNNSNNPTTGISPEERFRFFRAIMKLKPTPEPAPPQGEEAKKPLDPEGVPEGSVGEGVVVEAPFFCDYGYNIQIGNNVLIGPGCRISDTCAVKIGDDVIISTGVKIVTSTHPIDPKQRMAGKGISLGRSVIIDKGCWIGTDVTITPGVRISKNAVIAAGSLVCKDVPAYTIVAGNPQRVIRGIWDSRESQGYRGHRSKDKGKEREKGQIEIPNNSGPPFGPDPRDERKEQSQEPSRDEIQA